jgi:hypothetical protein
MGPQAGAKTRGTYCWAGRIIWPGVQLVLRWLWYPALFGRAILHEVRQADCPERSSFSYCDGSSCGAGRGNRRVRSAGAAQHPTFGDTLHDQRDSPVGGNRLDDDLRQDVFPVYAGPGWVAIRGQMGLGHSFLSWAASFRWAFFSDSSACCTWFWLGGYSHASRGRGCWGWYWGSWRCCVFLWGRRWGFIRCGCCCQRLPAASTSGWRGVMDGRIRRRFRRESGN